MASLSAGSLIRNNADIFFDFNAPVRTNDADLIADFSTRVSEHSAEDLSVFPSPVEDRLTIQANWAKGGELIFVLGMDGRMVLTSVFSRNGAMDVSGLAPGLYHLQMGSARVAFLKR